MSLSVHVWDLVGRQILDIVHGGIVCMQLHLEHQGAVAERDQPLVAREDRGRDEGHLDAGAAVHCVLVESGARV